MSKPGNPVSGERWAGGLGSQVLKAVAVSQGNWEVTVLPLCRGPPCSLLLKRAVVRTSIPPRAEPKWGGKVRSGEHGEMF